MNLLRVQVGLVEPAVRKLLWMPHAYGIKGDVVGKVADYSGEDVHAKLRDLLKRDT